jgi:hypothetical protein
MSPTTPNQTTLDPQALLTFASSLNDILTGLGAVASTSGSPGGGGGGGTDFISTAGAFKVGNVPAGGALQEVQELISYYSTAHQGTAQNVQATITTLKLLMDAATELHKVYTAAGHGEEVSVQQVKDAFNTAMTQISQPGTGPGTGPATNPGTTQTT